jgi:drug/metabolite transporter (DMT)-like permease
VTLALVLVSAFLHAAWNAMLRTEPDKDRSLVGAVAVATVLAAIVGGVRWGLGELPFASGAAVGWALAAGVLEWAYFITLARALERGPLGTVYTVSRGGAIIVIFPLSITLLHEHVDAFSFAGSAVVLAGIVLTGLPKTANRSAVTWAIVCAFAIAGYHLAYKAALDAGGSSSAVFAVALALATGLNAVRVRGVTAVVRARAPRIVAMGLVCGTSFLVLIEALTRGGAGFVLTSRNTSVLFAVILAAAIGERPSRAQVSGAVLVAAGAILMAW